LIEEVLTAWKGREVMIMLDGCFIRHKSLQILRVSLSHCYRAQPLAWEVVTCKGNVALDSCDTMLAPCASNHSSSNQSGMATRERLEGQKRQLPDDACARHSHQFQVSDTVLPVKWQFQGRVWAPGIAWPGRYSLLH
jgi:hypothetical protein